MSNSPRLRRLHNDFQSLVKLQEESSIFRFRSLASVPGSSADYYAVYFYGAGLKQATPQSRVELQPEHEIHIRLGAGYPRMMPELSWKSPIFHPNISASGVVCLGGYGTNWVPSLMLDDLCIMLWDMIRMENYDEHSPYNRDAARWLKTQDEFSLPLDQRSLRDLRAAQADGLRGQPQQMAPALLPKGTPIPKGKSRWNTSGRSPENAQPVAIESLPPTPSPTAETRRIDQTPQEANDWLYRVRPVAGREAEPDPGVHFLNDSAASHDIIEAELIEHRPTPGDSGILFIN